MKPDRTGEDLLFQVLLDWGLDLTLPDRRRAGRGARGLRRRRRRAHRLLRRRGHAPSSCGRSPSASRCAPCSATLASPPTTRGSTPSRSSGALARDRREGDLTPMKLQFKVQPYQTEAVDAVVDVFAGQPRRTRHLVPDRPRQGEAERRASPVRDQHDPGLRPAQRRDRALRDAAARRTFTRCRSRGTCRCRRRSSTARPRPVRRTSTSRWRPAPARPTSTSRRSWS